MATWQYYHQISNLWMLTIWRTRVKYSISRPEVCQSQSDCRASHRNKSKNSLFFNIITVMLLHDNLTQSNNYQQKHIWNSLFLFLFSESYPHFHIHFTVPPFISHEEDSPVFAVHYCPSLSRKKHNSFFQSWNMLLVVSFDKNQMFPEKINMVIYEFPEIC